jgi:hypothetical protein
MKSNEQIDSRDPKWAHEVAAKFTDAIVQHCRERVLAELDSDERKMLGACPTCHRRFRRKRTL